MEQSKGGLSVAMIISIIGWLVCAALAGIGLYVKGYDLPVAIVVTVIMLAIGIVGYVLGIMAKRTENEFKKWRTYEYFGVFMMAAALACAAMPFCWGANYLINVTNLSSAADSDKARVADLVETYKAQETQRLDHTAAGLLNFVQSHSNSASARLNDFVSHVVMLNEAGHINATIVNNFKEFNNGFIIRGAIDADPIGCLVSSVDSVFNVVNAMELNRFKDVQPGFDAASQNLSNFLNHMSADLDLPTVALNSGMFTAVDSDPNTYDTVKSSFGRIYSSIFEINVYDILAFLVFAFFALTHYLCEYHTYVVNTLPPVSDKDGILL